MPWPFKQPPWPKEPVHDCDRDGHMTATKNGETFCVFCGKRF